MNPIQSQPTSARDFDIRKLDYRLPESLIAQHPGQQRGDSRLLVVDRATRTLHDDHVRNLPIHLRSGDALVMNNTRVVPAKFQLRRTTGGIIEALFLSEPQPGQWSVLLKGAQRVAIGETLTVVDPTGGITKDAPKLTANAREERGRWQLQLCSSTNLPAAHTLLEQFGRMPLPPYIKRDKSGDQHDAEDTQRYQTVYAERPGAVAAPTAGLHFTESLMEEIDGANIATAFVTLHVGYGTFAPVEVQNLADHQMHEESFEISQKTCAKLTATRRDGGRVVAVGTTSARVLESVWQANAHKDGLASTTDLFCYPPYAFGGLDALMTNFHLPKSTLMALVMAFGGIDLMRRAYQHAIDAKYRFFSYGDAMLIV